MLTSLLILIVNIIIAVIILEIVFWILSAVLSFTIPARIRQLLYILVGLWFLVGVIGILSHGPTLYYSTVVR